LGPYEPLGEVTERLEREGYRRVYQGGHHDVWCDGERHVWRAGAGFVSEKMGNTHVRLEGGKGKCDCAAWVGRPSKC